MHVEYTTTCGPVCMQVDWNGLDQLESVALATLGSSHHIETTPLDHGDPPGCPCIFGLYCLKLEKETLTSMSIWGITIEHSAPEKESLYPPPVDGLV